MLSFYIVWSLWCVQNKNMDATHGRGQVFDKLEKLCLKYTNALQIIASRQITCEPQPTMLIHPKKKTAAMWCWIKDCTENYYKLSQKLVSEFMYKLNYVF